MTNRHAFLVKGFCGCILLVLTLGGVAGGQADGSRRKLQARVFMPNGSLSRNIKVKLENMLGEIVRDGFTDTEGYFEIDGLSLGAYQITVPTDGRVYETASERIDISEVSPRVVTLTIHLNFKGDDNTPRRSDRSIGLNESEGSVPAKAREAYRRGVALAKKNQLIEAIEQLKGAIAIYPGYVRAYNDLGLAYLKLDRIAEALAALERAVSIAPGAFNPRLNLAIAHVRKLDFAGAEAHLRVASSIDAASPLVHLYLGIVLYRTGRWDAAEGELSRAVALENGDVAIAHYYLGEIYSKRNRIGDAIGEFEAYLKENPNATDAPRLRAKIAELRAERK